METKLLNDLTRYDIVRVTSDKTDTMEVIPNKNGDWLKLYDVIDYLAQKEIEHEAQKELDHKASQCPRHKTGSWCHFFKGFICGSVPCIINARTAPGGYV
jgi:hypothetical protein